MLSPRSSTAICDDILENTDAAALSLSRGRGPSPGLEIIANFAAASRPGFVLTDRRACVIAGLGQRHSMPISKAAQGLLIRSRDGADAAPAITSSERACFGPRRYGLLWPRDLPETRHAPRKLERLPPPLLGRFPGLVAPATSEVNASRGGRLLRLACLFVLPRVSNLTLEPAHFVPNPLPSARETAPCSKAGQN